MEKGALQIISEALEEICEQYCKYPEEYLSKIKDPQDAMDAMQIERCENCPIANI